MKRECPGSLSDLHLTARFLPFSPPLFVFAAIRGGFSSLSLKRSLREASLRLAHQKTSLLLASGVPPSFVFAAIRGGFSSLLLKRSLREASLRLAHQKQASCLLLVCRLRSFSPPSVAAFPRYRLSTLYGMRVHRLAPLQKQASS